MLIQIFITKFRNFFTLRIFIPCCEHESIIYIFALRLYFQHIIARDKCTNIFYIIIINGDIYLINLII